MKVVFRVDSSVDMGTGHMMRCLTLADELCENSAGISFICRLLPGNICEFVEQKGYVVHRLPGHGQLLNSETEYTRSTHNTGVSWQVDAMETEVILKKDYPADWLIVDNYDLDRQWESQIRPYVKKIMVIDDLADRPHDCDLLLDQNLYDNIQSRYNGLVPDSCQTFLGPKHALLRKEFNEARKKQRKRDGKVRRIFIFFGGSDPTNETAKALEAVRLLDLADITVDAVVGNANPYKEDIKQFCTLLPKVNYFCHVNNMASLMANADLAIGAGGSTTWERCFLGLPTITLIVAQNQAGTTASAAAAGAVWNLGRSSDVSAERLAETVKKAIDNPIALKEMGQKSMELMGGKTSGSQNALIKAIMEEFDART
ncbi:UDP-2,4-diacetamido-2,4,6-trideoxy-beta-L-altropyranose hydrolase [Pelotomaculum propionicicum]|uniref:UDP-2,4-diacetamido-2,4, 6-trideoxy-beta-L-altropyranose hydrolase n=1 Tax=Pelotomaculum propionicicum TaxID=258475 RepID=UPI003B7F98A8